MSEPCAVHQPKEWAAWSTREAAAGRLPIPHVARACEECKARMVEWFGRKA